MSETETVQNRGERPRTGNSLDRYLSSSANALATSACASSIFDL